MAGEQPEIEALQRRLEELERERAEETARANAALAAAQDRLYWLDRWHLDLNAMMQRRGAAEFRAVVRGARKGVRAYKRVRARLRRRDR